MAVRESDLRELVEGGNSLQSIFSFIFPMAGSKQERIREVGHYLLEAKWTKDRVNLGDLRDLDGAVGSSLDNTLGLFISIEGGIQR
jgi:hypothetical protein